MTGQRRRVLEFEAHSKVDWLIRGHGAGQLLIEATGRPQVWSSTRRGFSVQERTALDVLALSERYGMDAVISGPRGERKETPLDTVETPIRDDDGVLW